MLSFSERMGLTPIRVEIQKSEIEPELKNALWNALYLYYFHKQESYLSYMDEPSRILMYRLWMHFLHRNFDEIGDSPLIIALSKEKFFKGKWFELLNLLEFMPNNYKLDDYKGGYENEKNDGFCSLCNSHFEKYLYSYRFIDRTLVEISSEEEVKSIEEALNQSKPSPVKLHLKRSLELLSDLTKPDYRNSIKEAISAVEAYCITITADEKASLGKALAIIERRYGLHGSLKTAFSALYGYTSDAGGIRHALLEDDNLSQEDAKFMLVTCSAFINYLTVKSK